MTFITLTALNDAVAAVVERYGDGAIYRMAGDNSRCLYSQNAMFNPEVGCLIGEALKELGVNTKAIDEHWPEGQGISLMSTEETANHGFVLDQDARTFACTVQDEQDSGKDWGSAMLAGQRALSEEYVELD